MNKWYLDGISDTGETFIGYSADLSWKSLGLSYASCLEFDGRHTPVTTTDLFSKYPPKQQQNGITWSSNGLECSGDWYEPLAEALPPQTLYQDEQGAVVWHCLQPLSMMNLQSSSLNFTGLGYVEQLELTILPWHLPMRELHWGRFLSSDAYLVWIEWRGIQPLTLIYLNGTALEDATMTDFGVFWNGGGLYLHDQIVLREGPLVKTALADIPGIRSLFPQQILYTNERKWRSRGTLSYDGTMHTGWVIHEVVRFHHHAQNN